MSQRAVEALLGRLLTDSDFRSRFFEEPATTCVADGLDLTAREIDAVLHLEQQRFEAFAHCLSPTIVRAVVGRRRGRTTVTKPAVIAR